MQVFRSRSSAAPASPVTTDPILAEHAAEIRRLGKRALADVIEIGARLTECKRICGHSNWLPWLDREFRWEETTAQRFPPDVKVIYPWDTTPFVVASMVQVAALIDPRVRY